MPMSKAMLAAQFGLLVGLTAFTPALAQTPSLVPQQQAPIGGAAPLTSPRPLPGVQTAVQMSPANFDKLRIQPGFLLHLTVLNEPQLGQDLRVDEEGNIHVSLLGAVHVQGLDEAGAQAAVASAYQQGDVLKNPQVALTIAQYVSPRISVLGQVQAPGEYELISPTDLLTVISMAGGPTTDAGNRVLLRHADTHKEEVVRFDRSGENENLQHFSVKAGDSVVVKRAGIVYVLGAVNRPGGYIMQPDGAMTVVQAVALALDTNLYASTQDIRIVRKTDEGIITIPVSYKKIVQGKMSPQALEPDDIVYVPTSKTKLTLINSKQLAFQASGAAIYGTLAH